MEQHGFILPPPHSLLGSARGWFSSWLAWQAHREQGGEESDAPEEPIVPGLASGMFAACGVCPRPPNGPKELAKCFKVS